MKIKKPYTNKEYADLAVYCNENNCHIEDKGDYLESVQNVLPEPTNEEQRQNRAEAYRLEKDPITCQITSLRDEEQTPEIVEEINELLQKRTEVVNNIKQRYPYSEEETNNSNNMLTETESKVIKNGL